MLTVKPEFTIWLAYVSNPFTTAVYIERALRKICRVITVGPTMPTALFQCMGNMPYELKPLNIETSFTPDMKALLHEVPADKHPDLYLWVDSVGRFSHLPQNLSSLKCPKACFLIDSHFNPPYYMQYAAQFDYIFMAQLNNLDFFRHVHPQSYWLPLACDPEIHCDFNIERIHPVGFVGGMNDNRKQLLADVERIAPVYYQSCFLHDMARVFSASKIGFNHASLDDLNMRFFELPSTGALHLFSHTRGSGQETLFRDGEEIVLYTEDTIGDVTQYYLEHDTLRKQIAASGKSLVRNAHTYDHRVCDLLNVIINCKRDTFSPVELRGQSLQGVMAGSLNEIDTGKNSLNSQPPKIRSIVSNRAGSQWPSWLMIYEWEDLLATGLSVDVEKMGTWFAQKNFACMEHEYYLCFFQVVSDLEQVSENTRLIPIVMDVWQHDIDFFIQYVAKLKLAFVASLEAFNILCERGCTNVAYLPYSVPDHYLLNAAPYKDIDIIQFGRTNPVLDHYMETLLQRFPRLNYVTTKIHDGMVFFHSTLHGLMGPSDSRKKFMGIVARSTVSLVSTAGMDNSRDTGGFNPVSPRFYESAAGYCRIIGRFPRNEEFDVLGFDKIVERVESYQKFEAAVMKYVGKPFDRVEEYRSLLKAHTTSNRAHSIDNALQNVHGLRAKADKRKIA